jgi:hypothetical protein
MVRATAASGREVEMTKTASLWVVLAAILVIGGCGKPSSEVAVTGRSDALGARVELDGNGVGVMNPIKSTGVGEWTAFCMCGATQDVHVVRVIMRDGRILEHRLEPATYVTVYVDPESLRVRYERE